MAEYRIVADSYLGFEVQIRRWWWPFWAEVGLCNTHSTLEKAEAYALHHANNFVLKNLGKLP